jgi:diphosphomevalonate decarboxylase
MKESCNNNNIISWKAPSNIALIKYWGKRSFQLPMNPSLSITLDNSTTTTEMSFEKNNNKKRKITFFFEQNENLPFASKIENHFEKIEEEFPIIKEYDFIINSCNTFPHSSGIASSASSMASLNLCVTSLLLRHDLIKKDYFFQVASRLSRMGSGSACRSLFANYTEWGVSSNEYATPVTEVHENFKNIHDAILIISGKEKAVSSRVGHSLMENHPFKEVRYKNAHTRLETLFHILSQGDWKNFIAIVEAEALELHAMMMCSTPPYILMKPNTLIIIDLITNFRRKTNFNICFTLDAGPNIHLLYSDDIKSNIHNFINTDLRPYLENGVWIDDKIGTGPINLT